MTGYWCDASTPSHQNSGTPSRRKVRKAVRNALNRIPRVVVFDDVVFEAGDICTREYVGEVDITLPYVAHFATCGIVFHVAKVCATGVLLKEGYVIRAGKKYELLATNSLSDMCMATPAFAGGALYIRTQSHLYRIEKK